MGLVELAGILPPYLLNILMVLQMLLPIIPTLLKQLMAQISKMKLS